MSDKMAPMTGLARLEALIIRLRAPDGCPWDRKQRLEDVRAYLLEEAHEVAAAIDGGDFAELRAELGDLLFQIVFIARLAEEAGSFTLEQVIDGVHAKMVDRHPHVFGGEALADAKAVVASWERRKLEHPARRSLLEGVPGSLPALVGAYRMTQKAAGVGFDWPDLAGVRQKLGEELGELDAALDAMPGDPASSKAAVREELGDVLFALANLARHLDLDPEAVLAEGNRKFRRRFEQVEARIAAQGRNLAESSLAEMDAIWEEIKREDRGEILKAPETAPKDRAPS